MHFLSTLDQAVSGVAGEEARILDKYLIEYKLQGIEFILNLSNIFYHYWYWIQNCHCSIHLMLNEFTVYLFLKLVRLRIAIQEVHGAQHQLDEKARRG